MVSTLQVGASRLVLLDPTPGPPNALPFTRGRRSRPSSATACSEAASQQASLFNYSRLSFHSARSPAKYAQPWDPRKAAFVSCRDVVPHGKRGGGDQEVMRTNR